MYEAKYNSTLVQAVATVPEDDTGAALLSYIRCVLERYDLLVDVFKISMLSRLPMTPCSTKTDTKVSGSASAHSSVGASGATAGSAACSWFVEELLRDEYANGIPLMRD